MSLRRLAWLAAQPVATVVGLGLIAWMDPAWLDRAAVWRAPRAPADLALYADDVHRGRALGALPPASGVSTPPLRTVEDGAASTVVDPARPARLPAPDGGSVELAAGALPARAAVTVAAVAYLPRAMEGPVTGPAIEIRVAGRERVAFGAPARVVLPYRRELFREGAPVVGLHENGAWRPLASQVDAARATVSADVPAAGVVAVLNPAMATPVAGALVAGTTLAAAGALLSTTEREQLWQAVYAAAGCTGVKETSEFVLHWCTKGPQAAEAGLADQIADGLARAAAGLGSVGMKPDAAVLRKYHVFLGATPSYGDTATGGPMFFNARMKAMAAADGVSPQDAVRATTAHELVHVAQGRSFSALGQNRYGFWLEMSAAYLADLYWDREGRPVDLVAETFLREAAGRLPAVPMDRADDADALAWAAFLRWLDTQKPGAGLAFTQAVNSRGEATLKVLDDVARESLGQPLAALATRFAQALHHDDLWAGTLVPRLHRGTAPLAAALAHTAADRAGAFAAVVVADPAGAVVTAPATSVSPPLPPLAATAFAMSTGPLDRRGRLVIRLSTLDGVEAWVGEGRVGALQLPARGPNRGFRRMTERVSVVDVGPDVDHVTVVVVNPSLDTPQPPVTAERWLLLPPETVAFRETAPRTWTVRWPRVALKAESGTFRGYAVYRRRPSASESAWTLAGADVTGETFTDRPPDGGEWLYTVRAVDTLGNESAPAATRDRGGFAGTWTGRVRVVDGGWNGAIAAALGVPPVTPSAAMARLGLPVTWRIADGAAGPELRVVRLGGWRGEGRPVALSVAGPDTLVSPALTLRRVRENEIREDGLRWPEASTTVAWSLRRTAD